MSEPNHDKQQAYLDGQMSDNDAQVYESTLTDDQKQQLLKEQNFTKSLEQQIKSNKVDCPEELWKNIQLQLQKKTPGTSHIVAHPIRNHLPSLIKLAAVFLFAIFVGLYSKYNSPSNLKKVTLWKPEIEGNLDKIHQLLVQQGYHLNFKAPSFSHHDVQFVGMDWVHPHEQAPVGARLLFLCCDVPVMIYIKKASDRPSRPLDIEREHRNLIHHLKKGDQRYLIDAYSNHYPQEVLDLIY